jgi:hypothetical protein
MTSIKNAASEFLAHRRSAVTGVSRSPATHGGNVVYRRLGERGYQVFAINPNADEVEGDPAYDDLHRSFGDGSVSEAATTYGRGHGIAVIDGGCPCMFDPTADIGHKAMRIVFTLNGHVPRQVSSS